MHTHTQALVHNPVCAHTCAPHTPTPSSHARKDTGGAGQQHAWEEGLFRELPCPLACAHGWIWVSPSHLPSPSTLQQPCTLPGGEEYVGSRCRHPRAAWHLSATWYTHIMAPWGACKSLPSRNRRLERKENFAYGRDKRTFPPCTPLPADPRLQGSAVLRLEGRTPGHLGRSTAGAQIT